MMRNFSCLILLFAMMPVGFFASSLQAFVTQDLEVKIGDVVEFKFLGKTQQATVSGFTGTGWPEVEFEWNGRKTTKFFPASRIDRIVKSEADAAEMNSEMRTWEDATGKFKIEAKMLSNQNGKIELEKQDGRVIYLELNQLSKEDREFIADLEAAKSSEDLNPFAGGELPSPRSSGSGRPLSGKKGPAGITPDYNANEIVLVDLGWNLKPDAATSNVSSSNKILSFAVKKNGHEFHNRLTGIQLSGNKRWMASCVSNPFEKSTQIVGIDLSTGKSFDPTLINQQEATLIGISDDGKTAAVLKESKGRNAGELSFWRLGETPDKIAAWRTAGFHDRKGFDPKSGLFLDEARLLTFGRRVVLWDTETATALYSYSINERVPPALSASRKQIAVVSGNSVFIVGAHDGKSLGVIAAPEVPTQLAFSANGRFLAGANRASGAIWVWDLEGNKLFQELSGQLKHDSSFEWIDDKYLLVGNTDLIDVALRAKVWNYDAEMRGEIISGNDGQFWFAQKARVAPVHLPHKNLDDLTAKFNPNQLLVLKPGASVAFQFDVPFSPEEKKQILTDLTKNFATNDVKVDVQSDLVLVCEVKKRESQTVEVSDFFSGPFSRQGNEKITFAPNIATMRLEKDGVVLWQRSTVFEPNGIIHVNDGESAQTAANRICKPDPLFFSQAKFPRYIGQLPKGKPLGSSTLTTSGIR